MSIARPLRRDLTIPRNVPFGRLWPFYFGDAPVDLAGYSARWQWRQYQGQQGAPVLDLSPVITDAQGCRIVSDGNSAGILNAVQLIIADAAFAALPAAVEFGDPRVPDAILFAHDLILTDLSGYEQRPLFGVITLISGVTR